MRFVASVLIFAVFLNLVPLACAKTTTTDKPAVIKAEVLRHGSGKDARVRVSRISGGPDVKGYISDIGEDSFVVVAEKTREKVSIPYSDVRKLRGPGGLSTGAKVGIGVAVGVGACMVLGLLAWKYNF